MNKTEQMTKTALVVDDSPTMRKVLVGFLKEMNWQVDEASNGVEALAILRQQKYGIVFTDLVMPELDGFELCEEIRKIPQLSQLLVVVISTYTDSHYITRALRLGADDFLAKPVSHKLLVNLLERVAIQINGEV